MGRDATVAEQIGRFREILEAISESGPCFETEYPTLREALLKNQQLHQLLPEFVVECRTARMFWNYIQQAFKKYRDRSRYIEAQLLPIERQFRPERERVPGVRPAEVRIEYSPVRPPSPSKHMYVAETRIAEP
jgi:hypothetical protein